MINLVLQGKGGVGKSLIAALMAQYFQEKNIPLYCADTDPVNTTFAGYSGFRVNVIKLLNESQQIDARAFDTLIDELLGHDGISIVDNGASTFVPLSAYLSENHIIPLFKESGREVCIHTVLTGGQAFTDTLLGLQHILATHETPVVVWQNSFFGELSNGGKTFQESSIFDRFKHKIKGIITIEKRNPDTFGKDLELLIKEKMTFADAFSSSAFGFMPKQRLKLIKTDIFSQLSAIGL